MGSTEKTMSNSNLKSQLIDLLNLQKLSVGILSANWLALSEALCVLQKNKCEVLHFDVADGQFCPLFTVGAGAIANFPSHFFKDVHLMVKDQLNVAKKAVSQGANLVTLQIEQQQDLMKTLDWLAEQNNVFQDKVYPVLTGLSICPETPIVGCVEYIDKVDVFQVLTLDPRTGKKYEKEFIKHRIDELCNLLSERRMTKLINVDGSMNLALAQYFSQNTDINWIISGSALFNGALAENLQEWKTANIF